jgi:hypothetical protein
MTDLAVIIVNWNVREMLAACLRSVLADLDHSSLSGQIWVVDNASTDGSAQMVRRVFPQVHLLASEENLGFAAGNNAALRAIGFVAAGKETPAEKEAAALPQTVLLLNPDTKVHTGALQTLFDFFETEPQAGLAGARLIYGDGSFQHSVFDFPGLWQLAIELLPLPDRLAETRLNGRYPRSLYESHHPFKVGHPLGAAMAVRREAILQVGLLDERYRMYVEEVDWAKRIVAAGWKAYCVPAASVTHFGGQSTGQVEATSFLNLWTSRYLFYRKHYHPFKVWLAGQIVQVGMGRQRRRDLAAVSRDELSPSTLAERLDCYQEVINVWKGKRGSPVVRQTK